MLYESPTIDVITLQAEGVICLSATLIWGDPGYAGGNFGDGGTYNL